VQSSDWGRAAPCRATTRDPLTQRSGFAGDVRGAAASMGQTLNLPSSDVKMITVGGVGRAGVPAVRLGSVWPVPYTLKHCSRSGQWAAGVGRTAEGWNCMTFVAAAGGM
jgi:hypothetical protein